MKTSAHKRSKSCMYHLTLILNDYSILLYLYCLSTRFYFSFHNRKPNDLFFFKRNLLIFSKPPFVIFVKTKKNRKTNYVLLFFLAILLTFHIVLFISISLFFIRKVLR